MPDYTAPGVYIEEVDLKPPAIEGVSLSTAGFAGATRRGPTLGRPVLVTGAAEFRRRFGGPFPATSPLAAVGDLPLAVEGFFANGGSRLYVMRTAPAGTTAARFAASGGVVTRLADGAAAAVGATTFRPASLRGLRPGLLVTFRMERDGVTYASSPIAIAANGIDRATGVVTLGAVIDIGPNTPPTTPTAFLPATTTVSTDANGIDLNTGAVTIGARPASLTLEAADGGAWGDGVVMVARAETGARASFAQFVSGGVDLNLVRLSSGAGFYVNAWVEIDRGAGADRIYRRVVSVDGPIVTLSGAVMAAADFAPAPAPGPTLLSVCEFSLTATYEATTERFAGLTLAPVPGRGVEEALARSTLLRVRAGTMPADTHPLVFPAGGDGARILVTTPGVDAVPQAVDVVGVDNGPGRRSGLRALEDVEDIAMIAAPGWGDQLVQQVMVDQCERMKYRIALLDPEPVGGAGPDLNGIVTQRGRFDSKYAVLYYPRVSVATLEGGARAIGPSGHVAGLIARIDSERGVVKTPANEVLRGLLDLEVVVNRAEHGVLNPEPNNINVIRDFRDERRGIRVYGGRVLTSLSDWKYLAVRRLFILIEKSIERGTQWAVFEPNNPALWARLIDSVDAFLTRLWRDGALLGLKKEQAFFIRCGTETMSQDDIDNGRLIMEIGIAPVKPAEFVIFRISQVASGALVEEA